MQNYIQELEALTDPSFDKIKALAGNSISKYSAEYQNSLWEQLKHGVALLNTHDHMCKQLALGGATIFTSPDSSQGTPEIENSPPPINT